MEPKKHFLEVIEDETKKRPHYYITNHPKALHPTFEFIISGKRNEPQEDCGSVLMHITDQSVSVITEGGWKETPHEEFQKVEIAHDDQNVLLYYENREAPVVLPIPLPPDPKSFIVTADHLDKVLMQMKEKGRYYDD